MTSPTVTTSNRSELEPLSRGVLLILAGAMLCSLVLHLLTPMASFYGEPDAATLVSDALLWVRGGIRTNAISEYRYYTSPAYIWFVTRLLPARGGDITAVITTLNRINLVMSAAIVVPFFLVCRRIAGQRAALIASGLISFVPTFFQGGLYGFPTLIGEFFLLWAIWLYDRWLTSERQWSADAWVLGAVCACLALALLVKADVYVGAVALWGLLLLRRRLSWTNAGALAIVGAVPVLVSYVVAHALLVQSPDTAHYAADWNQKFPFDPRRELNRTHILQVLKSMGVLSIPVFTVALVWLVRRRSYALAATLAVWAALPVLFWFFRFGDSARHHFPSSVPVTLGVAILFAALPGRDLARYAAAAALVLVNYFAFPPDASTLTTSGRLIASGRLTAAYAGAHTRAASEFADVAVSRKVFIGGWRRVWYVQNAVLARADSVLSYRLGVHYGIPSIDVVYLSGGARMESISLAATGRTPAALRAAADSSIRDGFRVFAIEFDSTLEHTLFSRQYRVSEYPAR